MKGKKSPMPAKVSPMLATLVKEPVTNDDYINEFKFDGYRIIAFKEKSRVRLDSRSGQDYTNKYGPIVSALKKISSDLVLDGEVCVLDNEGIPSFDALQKFNERGGNIVYYCFDLLWKDGNDLMHLPLIERKKILSGILKDNKVVRYSEHFSDAKALYQKVKEMGLEGIVSKKKDSTYKQAVRGTDWYKTPAKQRQEFVIGGYAESDRQRSFRSILFGAYNGKGELEWIGRSGAGYKERDMPVILKRLKALETNKSPFVNKVLDTKGSVIHYVKPQLVANFEFSGFTESGRIRKPATFLGFRDDKDPDQVVREIAKPVKNNSAKKNNKKIPIASLESNWHLIEKEKIRQKATFNLDNCDIELYNVDREIWRDITKADLIQYYHSIVDYILPYIKDRGQSLHIKPINANAPGFYIKDMEGRQPACASVFPVERKHKTKGKRDIIDYLVCNNVETLLWMVNLGCVDINPWTSRVQNYLQPDFIIIDLDPSDEDFVKAVETAKAAKEVFDKRRLTSFVKTSGKTGIHLYIPCRGFTFPQARKIAERICVEIHELVDDFTTLEVSKDLRGDRLFIDPSQNDEADTVAAPYSARPFHIPSVSTPLEWRELKPSLDPSLFTVNTIKTRLQKKGDIFQGVLDGTIAAKNSRILKALFK